MELFLGIFSGEWERRRAAILHDRERLGGGHSEFEDEWLKASSGGGIAAGPGPGFSRLSGGAGSESARSSIIFRGGDHSSRRSMETRLTAIARGSQPAVVKLASYGAGGRAGAVLDYLSREGRIALENERGDTIQGREGLTSVPDEWKHLMSNRAESRDVASFRFEIVGNHSQLDQDAEVDLAISVLKSGLGDRRFAFVFAREAGDRLVVRGLVVLRSPSSGERLTADVKAEEIVQDRLDQALARGEIGFPTFMTFTGYGNGVDYGTAKLRALVTDSSGSAVRNEGARIVADEVEAGALVQKTWRHEMESRKVRDVMHLIMSAREGTDVDDFRQATRAFLASEFAEKGFRYVFAVHDPKDDPKGELDGGKRPHVHAHAVVTMRSDFEDRIETSPQVFRNWRSNFASEARAAGINMEMTDRREFGSPPAFTKNQVRPINRSGRTELEGTSPAADRRYRDKRTNRSYKIPGTQRSMDYQKNVSRAWAEVVFNNSEKDVIVAAKAIVDRLEQIAVRTQISTEINEARSELASSDWTSFSDKLRDDSNLVGSARKDVDIAENRVESAGVGAEKNVEDKNRALMEKQILPVREPPEVTSAQFDLVEQTDRYDTLPESESAHALWDYYIARHGKDVVEKGNELMLDIEWAREEIVRIKVDESIIDLVQFHDLKSALNVALMNGAQLALDGNSFLQDMADLDMDLKAEIVSQRDQRSTMTERQAVAEQIIKLGSDLQVQPSNNASLQDDEQFTEVSAETIINQHIVLDSGLPEQPINEFDTAGSAAEVGSEIPSGENRGIHPVNRRVSRLEELQDAYEHQRSQEQQRDQDDR